ncbi:hypothetical protein DPMN_017903, partial [Dreissena polymorpha]
MAPDMQSGEEVSSRSYSQVPVDVAILCSTCHVPCGFNFDRLNVMSYRTVVPNDVAILKKWSYK